MKLPLRSSIGAWLVPWLVFGCQGCGKEKPYTPFGVTSALPSVAPPASAGPAASSGSAEQPAPLQKAELAPPNARRWKLDERELESPPGRIFAQGLALEGSPGEASSILSWTLPAPDAEGELSQGELWLYPAQGEARKIFDFPAFLPTGGSCKHDASLSKVNPTLVLLEVQAACDTQLLARAATRALVVLDANAAQPLRFGLRAAEAAPSEKFTLELIPRDEDGDGREDYRLVATLQTSTSSASARFLWLDRAAGVSRDTRQPERSLLDGLSKETVRARNAKNAAGSLARVDALRRLLGSLCAEGGSARVFDWEGAALKCDPLAESIDRLASVEVSAALTLGDAPFALSVLTRDGWYLHPMRAAQRALLSKEILKKLSPVSATRIALETRPRQAPSPHWSPLAFDDEGTLLLQSASGVHQVPRDAAREVPPALDGTPPWPLEVTNAAGERLSGVSYSCDRSEVSFISTAPSPVSVQPLLAPRPGVCAGSRFDAHFAPTPVAASKGFEVLVGGVLLAGGERSSSASALGSARSHDGKLLAIPTPLGLLLQGVKNELWSLDAWNAAEVSGCVVANGGLRAACVRQGRAELYLRDAPSP